MLEASQQSPSEVQPPQLVREQPGLVETIYADVCRQMHVQPLPLHQMPAIDTDHYPAGRGLWDV